MTESYPLRKFHNYIKNKLITSICSVGNQPISIIDTSIGQGGDIGKYLYSRNKINTFASIFPASDPKYVLVVMLDEPKPNKDYIYE